MVGAKGWGGGGANFVGLGLIFFFLQISIQLYNLRFRCIISLILVYIY